MEAFDEFFAWQDQQPEWYATTPLMLSTIQELYPVSSLDWLTDRTIHRRSRLRRPIKSMPRIDPFDGLSEFLAISRRGSFAAPLPNSV